MLACALLSANIIADLLGNSGFDAPRTRGRKACSGAAMVAAAPVGAACRLAFSCREPAQASRCIIHRMKGMQKRTLIEEISSRSPDRAAPDLLARRTRERPEQKASYSLCYQAHSPIADWCGESRSLRNLFPAPVRLGFTHLAPCRDQGAYRPLRGWCRESPSCWRSRSAWLLLPWPAPPRPQPQRSFDFHAAMPQP